MTPELTSKPVHYEPVGSDFLVYGISDLNERERSIDYTALGIQDFTLMFLLMRVEDLDEGIHTVLRIGMLGVKLLFELGIFAAWRTGISMERASGWRWMHSRRLSAVC